MITSCNHLKRTPQPKILFPNEHGAWAMFFTAFLLGWLAAPVISWRPLFLLPAAIGAFLVRYPIGLYFKKRRVTRAMKIPLTREKKWFWIYSLLTLILAIPLFYPLAWWWLLIFAALASFSLVGHLRAITQRKERTLFTEVTAMMGISFLAPAASYAALLRFSWSPILIWLSLVIFYIQRIIVIRRKVAQRGEKAVDVKEIGKRELLYSLLFVIVVVALSQSLYRLI